MGPGELPIDRRKPARYYYRSLRKEDRRTTLQMTADRLNIGKETVRWIQSRLGKKKDLRDICSSRLDRRAETRTRCLLTGSFFNGAR